MIDVLVVDNHPIVRMGLVSGLSAEPDLHVVGEAKDGAEAVRLVAELKPRVVLMDIAMPQLNGIEAARRIRKECPGTQVIGLSVHRDRGYIEAILSAGATGYVFKDSPVQEVVQAIRTVACGNVYLSPEATTCFVRGPFSESPTAALTPREEEILRYIAVGKATKEIAHALKISVKTVETHRHAIMTKLRLHSVAELTKWAIRRGLTPLGD